MLKQAQKPNFWKLFKNMFDFIFEKFIFGLKSIKLIKYWRAEIKYHRLKFRKSVES